MNDDISVYKMFDSSEELYFKGKITSKISDRVYICDNFIIDLFYLNETKSYKNITLKRIITSYLLSKNHENFSIDIYDSGNTNCNIYASETATFIEQLSDSFKKQLDYKVDNTGNLFIFEKKNDYRNLSLYKDEKIVYEDVWNLIIEKEGLQLKNSELIKYKDKYYVLKEKIERLNLDRVATTLMYEVENELY